MGGVSAATDRLSRLLDELWSLCRCRCVACTRERVGRALADAADEPERPERCPTCGSDDPAVCNVIWPHPHGTGTTPCCRHPWHDGASQ